MSSEVQAVGLPLFYSQPQPLSPALHADWRLKDGDAAFAAQTPFVPVVVGELAAAARTYPVVFAGGDAQPLAVLGLEQRNLFVDAGQWAKDAYVPAYVRRYPFGFIATTNPEGFALAIDAGTDRVDQTGGEGAPLFDEGQPTDLTRQALAFCDAFQGEAAATNAFAKALTTEGLLIERRADATLPDGRKLAVGGFQIVDADRFAALPDATVVDWHRKGWLALVHFHLASLERFSVLLDRQQAVVGVSQQNGSEDRVAVETGRKPKSRKA
ncbi:SapC family protein [Brevundimonas sp.]|uniref:SapC family protein n=1 Tax=Brevundimonas sp. TaxID=1871086 RepID=UPI0025BFF965|nr:SapC family protein [Brevundimonas sp.]